MVKHFYGYVFGDPVNLVDPNGEFAFIAIPWIVEGAEWAYAGYRAYRAARAAKTAYDIAKSFPAYDDTGSGNVCYSKKFDPTKWKKRKHPKTGRPGYERDDGSIWEKDRAGTRGHGGSAWKRWKNRRDWERGRPREGTYDKDGNRLRG